MKWIAVKKVQERFRGIAVNPDRGIRMSDRSRSKQMLLHRRTIALATVLSLCSELGAMVSASADQANSWTSIRPTPTWSVEDARKLRENERALATAQNSSARQDQDRINALQNENRALTEKRAAFNLRDGHSVMAPNFEPHYDQLEAEAGRTGPETPSKEVAENTLVQSRRSKGSRPETPASERAGTPSGASGVASSGPGYTATKEKDSLATSEDKCSYSGSYDGNWTCNSTETVGTVAQVSNQLTQTAGAAMVQMQGQQNSVKAANSGTQSAAYEAAADSAKKTATIEMGTGLLNTGFGAVLIGLGMNHSQKAKKASAASKGHLSLDASGNAVAGASTESTSEASTPKNANAMPATAKEQKSAAGGNKMLQDMAQKLGADDFGTLTAQQGDPQWQAAVQAKEAHVNKVLKGTATEISKEQSAASKGAMTQGMMSLMTGAGQIMMSLAHKNAAKSLQNNADQIKNMEGQRGSFVMPLVSPGNGAVPPTFNGVVAPVISAAEQTPGPEETSSLHVDNPNNDDEKPLPLGVDPKGFAGLPTPGPQNFNAPGSPDSGSGAGISGAGIAGGGGDGHGDGSQGGALPREADPRYVGGGSSGAYGRGGGNGGGSAAPDISGMMDKLMNAGKEEHAGQKPNLEEFGRDPASEMPYSFLDKSVNIFQRVHQSYQQKAKAGRVALF